MEHQLFFYRAVDPAGQIHSGEMTSASRSSVLEALSSKGWVPIELCEAAARATGANTATKFLLQFRRSRQMSTRELLALTQSLASLLNAGLTVERALQISVSLAGRISSRAATEKILQSVRAGKTLSQSFGSISQKFPPYYINMVDAGEIGGSLAATLNRLMELMRRQLEIRERIRSALLYPMLLAAVVLFTLVILLTFVLPRFETLFAESEAALPWSTSVVLAVGRFVAEYWWLLLSVFGCVMLGIAGWLRTTTGRLRFDRWLLKSRVTLGLPAAIDTARLLRTVSTLCRNGLPLPAALRVARGTLTNVCLLESLSVVTREVQAGESFSLALARTQVFPTTAVQLSRVGEETGRLDELMLSAAGVLEEESQIKLERLLNLTVPLLTVAMGLIVAGLIGSVLIGLLSINDLAL